MIKGYKWSLRTLVRTWCSLIGWIMLGSLAMSWGFAIVNQYIGWINYITK